MYAVILAGGGGTRLWPLSRPDRPKPFLPLLGAETLLQATVRRLLDGPELGLTRADVAVVTDRRYLALVRRQLGDVRVLAEPQGRNTAAAVALAAIALDRPEDEVMLVLPADHRIDPAREADFRRVLAAAGRLAAEGGVGIASPLVTLGVRPTHPATAYGYLVPAVEEEAEVAGLRAWPLRAFEEKPAAARARALLDGGGVAWNAGMFLWRRAAIRAALERYTSLETLLGGAVGSEVALAAAYEAIQPRSIDTAVMEGAASDRRVAMAALEVGWSDLGSWTALLEALGVPAEGSVLAPGQTVPVGEADLVVDREPAGPVIRPAAAGTITPERPMALLRGARPHEAVVRALLDRCAAAEAGA